ncbi:hypothetical protein M917_1967 [Psychrobacter aquaticus CMS 56]|uniref:Uncharacterized protein n=1 Tax=Psychrobacter aquaticus CMS 56 TaxID=1354303 RepID=U4T942_9GAMM|nr:hypothetical protein M917_1967 [Psychrobacter aquaticus CMS 56]
MAGRFISDGLMFQSLYTQNHGLQSFKCEVFKNEFLMGERD